MISFTVFGKPQPQGSAKAFAVKGRAFVTDTNAKLRPWRQQISQTAWDEMARAGLKCLDRSVPVRMDIVFYFARPKSLKKSVIHKVTRPDLLKLGRALEDGLTGIVFQDDSQVVESYPRKVFGEPERTEIVVTTLFGEGEEETK